MSGDTEGYCSFCKEREERIATLEKARAEGSAILAAIEKVQSDFYAQASEVRASMAEAESECLAQAYCLFYLYSENQRLEKALEAERKRREQFEDEFNEFRRRRRSRRRGDGASSSGPQAAPAA